MPRPHPDERTLDRGRDRPPHRPHQRRGDGERLGLVERAADPADRRKVLVRVRGDKIGAIAAHYTPLEKSMQALLAGYSREELKILIDFAEKSSELLQARVSELNDSK